MRIITKQRYRHIFDRRKSKQYPSWIFSEGNQSSTLLEYFQHYSKNIIVIFKRNQFIGFDDHSKTRRQILFKALSTKRIVKIFPTGRINIFRENWAKLNPKYITINRRLKIAIFEDPLPRKPTKGNSYAPRSKITWGCRNKGTFEEGAAKDVTSARGQFVSTIFLRPMKEKTFRPNLKNLNQVLPYQEFKT